MNQHKLSEPAHSVDAIVFDLGNVLIDWNPRHLYRKIFGADEAAMEFFLAEVCNTPWNERQDCGRPWKDAIAEAVSRHPAQHPDRLRLFSLPMPNGVKVRRGLVVTVA